jgi:hypothetical protein
VGVVRLSALSRSLEILRMTNKFKDSDRVNKTQIATGLIFAKKFSHIPIWNHADHAPKKKIFRNSSAAEDVVTEEYFEKFFCCTKISFVRAQIHSLQINIFGMERIFTLPEEYLCQ